MLSTVLCSQLKGYLTTLPVSRPSNLSTITEELQNFQKLWDNSHVTVSGAAAASTAGGGAGYTNAAAAEFTREEENQ